jgi:hypothetical protein
MISRFFVEHPKTVGESYLEHMAQSFGFGTKMIAAGIACLLHGLVPGCFVKTGSNAVTRLHFQMVSHRQRKPPETPVPNDFVI